MNIPRRSSVNIKENKLKLKNSIYKKALHVISAVVGGAIAGAALGLLVAPEKGEKTRKKIIKVLKEKGVNLKKEKMEELAEEIEDQLENHI